MVYPMTMEPRVETEGEGEVAGPGPETGGSDPLGGYGGSAGAGGEGDFHDDQSYRSDLSTRPHPMYGGYAGKAASLGQATRHTLSYLGTRGGGSGGSGRDIRGNMAAMEPGHHLIFKWVRGRRVPVEMYMTRVQPGTLIRHAVSGIREKNMRVGRRDEYAYFKVAMATGEAGQNRYGNLFYTSPEEFERHFHCTVSQEVKERWMDRQLEYQKQVMREATRRDMTGEEGAGAGEPAYVTIR